MRTQAWSTGGNIGVEMCRIGWAIRGQFKGGIYLMESVDLSVGEWE